MFEIWISDELNEPHGVQPLATAATYEQAKTVADERAPDFYFGTVIVAPNGQCICGDETPGELAAILATP